MHMMHEVSLPSFHERRFVELCAAKLLPLDTRACNSLTASHFISYFKLTSEPCTSEVFGEQKVLFLLYMRLLNRRVTLANSSKLVWFRGLRT